MSAKASKAQAALLETAATALRPYAAKPLKAAFLERGLGVLTELADALDADQLQRAVAAGSHGAALLHALEQPEALRALRIEGDPMAKARLRGLARRAELLEAEGGTVSTEELATALHLTPQAVHKRRVAGKLLGVELGRRGVRFPVWQLTDEGVVPGLEEVLGALEEHPPLACVRFFLAKSLHLGGKRPLDVLRKGKVQAVVDAARAFGEQGAA
jgi:hypothetical protein